jgi:hypothetical protein
MNPWRSWRTSMHRVVRNMLFPFGFIRWRQLCCVGIGVGIGEVLGQPGLAPTRHSIPTAVPVADAMTDAPQRASRTPTNVPARRISDTTDTGDYALGHRNFARYTTPLLCVEAARTEAAFARRTVAVAAAAYTIQHTAPEQDTLPARVTRVARACGARFLDQPLTQMDTADLPALFELALLAHQDTLAQAILARSAALAPTDAARQQVWVDGLDTLLHAEPARVAVAMALVTQWNGLGRSALALQVQGASRLLGFWQDHFDRARMRAGAEALLQLEPDPNLPVATRISLLYGRIAAYGALWQSAAVDHPDSFAVVGQRVIQDLQRPVWDMPGWQQIKLRWVREFQSDRHDAGALRAFVMERSDAFHNLRVDGQPMAPLTADAWFLPASATERDTVYPALGHVSLFVRPNQGCYDTHLWDSWGDDESCTPELDRLTRWQRQYGPAGLKLIVVGYTEGSALYSGPLPPAGQAQAIAWYVQHFGQLPVTVAVQERLQHRHPLPDGTVFHDKPLFDWMARTIRDPQNNKAINTWYDHFAVLTDRARRLVYIGPDDSALLEAVLARVMAPTTTTAVTPPIARSAPVTP